MTAPLPRRVIVDDADPQIQYSSTDQWKLSTGGPPLQDFKTFPNELFLNGPPFRNTTHFTNTTLSLSLQFRGSQPQVFGTGAHYECFVDDTSIGSEPNDEVILGNNILLCDGAQISEAGEYTLTLNVTHESEFGFYFDYITYIPSTSDPQGSATVLVDKLDPAVAYSATLGQWGPGPLPNQLRQSGQLDTGPPPVNLGAFTRANGSSLAFNFDGTSVSWVGFILGLNSIPGQNQSTSNAIYSIDNAEPVPFSFHASILNLTRQVLFTSPTLNPGPHSLEVTHQGNFTTPSLVLDYLIVTNNVSTPSLPILPANKPSMSVPIGAIVGGAVGGIAVLCLAAFLLRRRIRHKRFSTNHDNNPTPHPMPFDATPPGPTVGKAGDRTLKVHRSLMVDPPELNAAPQAETFNQWESLLRTPPEDTVHEDGSARSVTDGVADPPPSYVSQ